MPVRSGGRCLLLVGLLLVVVVVRASLDDNSVLEFHGARTGDYYRRHLVDAYPWSLNAEESLESDAGVWTSENDILLDEYDDDDVGAIALCKEDFLFYV